MLSVRSSLGLFAILVSACGGSSSNANFAEPDGGAEDAIATDASGTDASGTDTSVSGDTAAVDASCEGGTTGREACGKCGERVRVCNSSGAWSEWSACSGETGICVAGAKEEEACGVGGTRSRTCSATCSWGAFSLCIGGTTPCAAGAVEEMACEKCGKQVRVCGSDLKWSDFSTCMSQGVCASGAKEEEVCGVTGKRTRTCSSACTWSTFGGCVGGAAPTEIWVAALSGGTGALSGTIERVSIADGSLNGTIPLPTVASGPNRPIVFATDPLFGDAQIVRRPDRSGVTMIGFDAAVGSTSLTSAPRVVAQIDAGGTVDTHVTNTGLASISVRSVTTDDGARFWVGAPDGLFKIDASAPTVANDIDSPTVRWVEIIGGSLHITDSNGSVAAYSGLPLVASKPVPLFSSSGGLYGMVALSIAGAGLDRIYLATADGIEQWSKGGTSWSRVKVIPGGTRHIAGFVSGTDVILYATRGGNLAFYVDKGTATIPTLTPVRDLPTGSFYRGVSLAPQ